MRILPFHFGAKKVCKALGNISAFDQVRIVGDHVESFGVNRPKSLFVLILRAKRSPLRRVITVDQALFEQAIKIHFRFVDDVGLDSFGLSFHHNSSRRDVRNRGE